MLVAADAAKHDRALARPVRIKGARSVITRTLLLAGAAALVPTALLTNPAAAAPGDLQRRFAPPGEPQVLTRTLVRTLRDGKQIVVRRSYAVRFVARGDGYIVEGRQISATVDAPAKLASLADIERNQVDEGMFPMQLNAAGQIAAMPPPPAQPGPAHHAAVAQSHRMIDQSSLPSQAKPEAHRQVNLIAANGANGNEWPADLFSPAAHDRTDRQRFALPDGSEGDVEVAIRVETAGPGELPTRMERTVTTVIGTDSRVSQEIWTLGPAAGMY